MTRRICISSAVLFLIAWLVISESGAQQNDELGNAAKIRELQQQRFDALRKRYEVVQARYDDGSLGLEDVVAAQDALLIAKLEIAESRQEQLQIGKERIDNLRSKEKLEDVKFESGRGRAEDRYAAKAARIQAEIDFLRLESGLD